MTDDWLRDALDDAVSDVEPREALDSIRSRTKVTPMSSKRPWIYGVGGAVLATAATITAFALVNSGTNSAGEDPGVADPPSSTATESPGTATPGTSTESAPVYYLGEVTFHQGEGGDMQTAFRLYREWHDVQVVGPAGAEGLAKAALQAMFDAPADADYSTAWQGEVLGVTHEDGVITVDLSDGIRSMSVGSESAELSVQQLVYTVQAALSVADDDAATDPVRILVEGESAGDLWGHVDASKPIARADATGVVAPIWITSPSEGATFPAAALSTVTVTGVAQVFEGNVSWRLLEDGAEVDNGFTTTSEGAPAFGDFEFNLENLSPGTYVLEVFEASALDGSDTFMDTKSFTVG
jgi:hypothetical protein